MFPENASILPTNERSHEFIGLANFRPPCARLQRVALFKSLTTGRTLGTLYLLSVALL